eukprot:m.72771 g.72771  ORF g.72771 m.72771 type:complete len:444 (-) comp14280_c0_seq4:131-1462(-)
MMASLNWRKTDACAITTDSSALLIPTAASLNTTTAAATPMLFNPNTSSHPGMLAGANPFAMMQMMMAAGMPAMQMGPQAIMMQQMQMQAAAIQMMAHAQQQNAAVRCPYPAIPNMMAPALTARAPHEAHPNGLLAGSSGSVDGGPMSTQPQSAQNPRQTLEQMEMAQAMTRDTRRRERNRAKSIRYRRRKRARLSNYQTTSKSLHAHCAQYHAAIVGATKLNDPDRQAREDHDEEMLVREYKTLCGCLTKPFTDPHVRASLPAQLADWEQSEEALSMTEDQRLRQRNRLHSRLYRREKRAELESWEGLEIQYRRLNDIQAKLLASLKLSSVQVSVWDSSVVGSDHEGEDSKDSDDGAADSAKRPHTDITPVDEALALSPEQACPDELMTIVTMDQKAESASKQAKMDLPQGSPASAISLPHKEPSESEAKSAEMNTQEKVQEQ